jgi:hypothetical protein
MTSTLGVAMNGKENHRLFTPKGIDEFEVRTPPPLSSYHNQATGTTACPLQLLEALVSDVLLLLPFSRTLCVLQVETLRLCSGDEFDLPSVNSAAIILVLSGKHFSHCILRSLRCELLQSYDKSACEPSPHSSSCVLDGLRHGCRRRGRGADGDAEGLGLRPARQHEAAHRSR